MSTLIFAIVLGAIIAGGGYLWYRSHVGKFHE